MSCHYELIIKKNKDNINIKDEYEIVFIHNILSW